MDIENQILAKVSECMALAQKKFSLHQFQDPKVFFDIKGTNGGTAFYKDMSVHFNLDLAIKNGEKYINQTVPREIAHLIDYQVYKGWGHKRTWKMIMKYVFGLEPDRCHNFDTSEVKIKKYDTYLYICNCSVQHKIKTNKHKKISLGLKRYRCLKCFGPIVFKQYIGKM